MNKIQSIQDDISRTKVEIDIILENYEVLIKGKINEFDKADEIGRKNIIKELLTIQAEISEVVIHYSYPATKFITDFVYDFDQKNEVSIDYIIDKMNKISNSDSD